MEESPKVLDLISVTKSPGWNGLKTLGACVSGRLGRQPRAGKPHHRPKKSANNAALIEMDLDPILRADYSVIDLPKEAFDMMDDAAINVLRSLNTMANLQLITDQTAAAKLDGAAEAIETEDSSLTDLRANIDEVAMLGDGFERLRTLLIFLVAPSTRADKRGLSLGTGVYPLFTLPPGDTGDLTIDRLRRWNGILKILPGRSSPFEDCSFVSSEVNEEPAEYHEWNELRGKRVSSIVEVIFNEFRQLSCVKKTTHEILLYVSNDLHATHPDHLHNLDMFISRCPGSNLIWQDAECGHFDVRVSGKEKCICDGINQAMEDRKKLRVLVDDRGVFDVTASVHPVPLSHDSFDGKSLSELLGNDVFGPIDTQAYLNKTAASKVDSAAKAQVALGLSRCLMDFFDKGLELASHSWIAENVHFRESSTNKKGEMQRLLYVSLRPNLDQEPGSDMAKMFKSGNPVILSFAKLLLEVLDGKAINIQISPDDNKNIPSWSDLGDVVENLLHDRGGEPFASEYLKVVDACLGLWATLKSFDNRTDLTATSQFVRKAIYEKMVRKLEVLASSEQARQGRSGAIVRPERRKRKAQSPTFDEPAAKKLSLLRQHPPMPGAPGSVNGHGLDGMASEFRQGTGVKEDESAQHTEEHKGAYGRASLYDEQAEASQDDRRTAEEYLNELRKSIEKYVKPLKDYSPNERNPIKIAIIDSGVDLCDPSIRARRCQIRGMRNWTSAQHDECGDECGHGTHVTRLILETAPAVEVYIAKISKRKKLDSEVSGRIAQAIEWATGVWKVDIISLSIAMNSQDETVRKALDRVLDPPDDGLKNVVVMAAASNWGGNQDIAFPACYEDIICVHSTDGYGNPSKTNPTAQEGKDFSMLGMSIKSSFKRKGERRAEVYISGTSYATAIGAGITANILDFARRDPKLRDGDKWWLFSSSGMTCVLRRMCEERGGYRYVMPWKLFDGRDEEDIWRDIRRALKSR